MIEPKSVSGASRPDRARSRSSAHPRAPASPRCPRPLAFRSSAAAFDSSTMSVTLMSSIPPGATSSGRCSVTAPTKPTLTPPKSLVHVGGRARSSFDLDPHVGRQVLPLGATIRVGDRSRVPSPGSTRSSYPWSNSWLPTEDTSRPASFSASIVGLSFGMNDSNVDAPIRSPAAANTVSGFSRTQLLHCAGHHPSTRRRPTMGSFAIRPWKSFVARIWMSLVVGVRHVDAHDLRAVVGRSERTAVVEVGDVGVVSGCTRSRRTRSR